MTVAAALFALSGAGMLLAAGVPDFAEWYSQKIYPLLTGSLGRVSGFVPFSVSKVGIYTLLAAFFITLFLTVRNMLKGNGSRALVSWFSGVLLAVGILAFLYTACCGINYHRRSFSEEEGIVTYNYSASELKEICIWLTEEVNARADEVSRDGQGVMELDAPEELLLSEVLSYQSLTGIYLPFTVEANYNGDMTAYNKPFTVCHELSHLRGFMEEQEANIIAFLACVGSERMDFQYSGYLSGWVYCMNALYRADYESWEEVRILLDEAAEPDQRRLSEGQRTGGRRTEL